MKKKTLLMFVCVMIMFCSLCFTACEFNISLVDLIYDVLHSHISSEYPDFPSDNTSCQDGGEHRYEVVVKDATCTEAGAAMQLCTVCGHTGGVVTYDALGHDFVTEIIQMATCQQEGIVHNTCSRCNLNEEKNTGKGEHVLSQINSQAATCEADGFTLYCCSVCNVQVKRTELDQKALGHDYVGVVTKSTCTQSGYTKYTCTRCKNSYVTDESDPLGHSYTGTVYKPNSVYNGYTHYKCSNCNDSYEDNEVSYTKSTEIDTSVIDYVYPSANTESRRNRIDSVDQLQVVYDNALLTRNTRISLYAYYSGGDFKSNLSESEKTKMADRLYENTSTEVEHTQENFSYTSYGSYAKITIIFSYYDDPTETTSARSRYTKLTSVNQLAASGSSHSFAVDSRKNTFECSTTEQLWMCIELGYRPICQKGSVAETVYNKARSVLNTIVNKSMTNVQKTEAIYSWLANTVSFDNALYMNILDDISGWQKYKGNSLEGVFIDSCGTTAAVAKAFTLMTGIEGIQSVVVRGYETGHTDYVWYWNKVKLDGKWYCVQASTAQTVYTNTYEYVNYGLFLMKDADMAANYTALTYTNLRANNAYDYFSTHSYTYEGKDHTYAIGSAEELKTAVAYWTEKGSKSTTMCIRLDFEYSNLSSLITDCNYFVVGDVVILNFLNFSLLGA